MSLEEYFGDWIRVINQKELNTVIGTMNRIYSSKKVCPAAENVFRAFDLCPYNELKVVFVGQDPYPQKDVATGILFGNRADVPEDELSPSLKVVKEAAVNFEIPHNSIIFDQTLESWARQEILMINSALTVEMNKVGSHTMLWRPFISSLLKNISETNPGLIYVLFGSQAGTFQPYIKTGTVIKVPHPAYNARTETKMNPELFTDINRELKSKYGTTIKWYQEY
nr:MAG TPA: hypothetical protein [Caudoviricetes sp.]